MHFLFKKSFVTPYISISGGYAYLLWKKKKSCLKRKRTRKQTEEEGKLRQLRKEDYRSKVHILLVEQLREEGDIELFITLVPKVL